MTDLRLEQGGEMIDSPASGKDFDIVVSFETADGEPMRGVNFGIVIAAHGDDKPLINIYSETAGAPFREVPGQGEVRCRVKRCPLPAGQYYVGVWCDAGQQMLDAITRAADLTVGGGDFYGSGREQMGPRTVLVDHSWSIADRSSKGKRSALGEPTAAEVK